MDASKDESGQNIAYEMRDAMELNQLIYLILTFFCAVSCLGGPFLCVRWLSVPLHLIFGLGLNLYAIFNIIEVRDLDGFE